MEDKMKAIRDDVMLSLYHDLTTEQYMQFVGLSLIKESLEQKTYKSIWATPDFSKTALILIKDCTIPDYPMQIKVTGMAGFSAA
ncbi:MAG: hypothetical protein LKF71_06230 [Oscillospiraceae bacterium]|jgi:hypothetical protein|nr:hypothetical protein [Oscillospiraceae bacterium]